MEKLFGLLQGEQYYNKMHRLICHFCFYSSIKNDGVRYHEHDFWGTDALKYGYKRKSCKGLARHNDIR